jgi:hypothetical protein
VEEVKALFALPILFFSFSVSVFGQLVCTNEKCDVSAACEREKAPANFVLPSDRTVRGQVVDPSGAPLDSRHQVQLRDVPTGKILVAVNLDGYGRFDLGKTASDEYRLIVVEIKNGVAKRFGFDQPSHVDCVGETVCETRVVLPVGATDRPENFCDPK